MNLGTLLEQHREMYSWRNHIRFRGIAERCFFLMNAADDLDKALRRSQDQPAVVATALARLLTRGFCVAEYYGKGLPLPGAFAKKYLANCAYCHNLPCTCEEIRPEPKYGDVPVDQEHLSLNEIAAHLDHLYGEKNRAHGIFYMLGRLYSEISEIGIWGIDAPGRKQPNSVVYFKIAAELSDLIAWIIGIGNLLEVNLEQAWQEMYRNGCPKCNLARCDCGPYEKHEEELEFESA